MGGEAKSYLQVDSLGIRYGGVQVVSDISFEIRMGEFVTLVGPSGSGKTSILNAIAGFVRPSEGAVCIEGGNINAIPPFRRDFGMVFQSYALFPHMTVHDNIAFGLARRRMAKSAIAERVSELLNIVRLKDLADRFPAQLSGGQQQRVAIARAVAFGPRLLLLDEPMSNLDAQLRASMRTELLRIVERVGITAICVTHDQTEALSMSDRVVVLAGGQVQQIGTPYDVYHRPANEFVANFIGQSNLLTDTHASVAHGAQSDGAFCCSAGARTEPVLNHDPGRVFLLRPEDIRISAQVDAGGRRGRILRSSFMGPFSIYVVELDGQQLTVQRPADAARLTFRPGDEVSVEWDSSALVRLKP